MALFGGSKLFDKSFAGFDPQEEERIRQALAAQAASGMGNQAGPLPSPQAAFEDTASLKQQQKLGMFGAANPVANAPGAAIGEITPPAMLRPRPAATLANAPGRAPWELSRGEKFASTMGSLGNALMAAQASIDGDFSTAATIGQASQKAAMDQQQRRQIAEAMRSQGYDDNTIMLALTDTSSIGKNLNERLGTRVVAPGSSIVSGGPNGQQATYSQPNQYHQYAVSQGLQPGTPEYNRAIEAYVLRGNSATAMGYDQQLDDTRTANDVRLEGVRQSNRMKLKQAPAYRDTHAPPPTYRDIHGPPPRAPSNGGGSSRGSSLPVVSSPADAAKLPKGTKFRTPDGRVMQVP